MQITYDDQGNAYGPDGNQLDNERTARLLNNLTEENEQLQEKVRDAEHSYALVENQQYDIQQMKAETERLQQEAQRRDIADDAKLFNAVDADAVSRVLDAELWKVDKQAAFDQLREQHPKLFAADPAQGIPAKQADKGTNSGGLLGNLFSRR